MCSILSYDGVVSYAIIVVINSFYTREL